MKTVKVSNEAYELLCSRATKKTRKGDDSINQIASEAIKQSLLNGPGLEETVRRAVREELKARDKTGQK